MGGLLALAGIGLFFLFMGKSKASSTTSSPQGGGLREGGASPFKLVPTGESGGEAFYDVIAKANSFGPHQEFLVLSYKETPQGQRVLLSESQDAPAQVRQAARNQFGLLPIPAAAV